MESLPVDNFAASPRLPDHPITDAAVETTADRA